MIENNHSYALTLTFNRAAFLRRSLVGQDSSKRLTPNLHRQDLTEYESTLVLVSIAPCGRSFAMYNSNIPHLRPKT